MKFIGTGVWLAMVVLLTACAAAPEAGGSAAVGGGAAIGGNGGTRGMLASELMWSGAPGTAVYVHVSSSLYDYKGCLRTAASRRALCTAFHLGGVRRRF